MLLCSLISVFTVLLIRGGIDMAICFVIAFLAAIVCTIAELCTKGGFDTITCPTVAMVIIIPLVKILGG